MLRPTFHVLVTPETVRVTLDGAGVVLEDAALIALMFDARAASPVPLAVGREAMEIEPRLGDLQLDDLQQRRACLVAVEQARWYDADRTLTPSPIPELGEPWEHHGEVILVHPFGPEGGSVRVWGWVFATLWARVFTEGLPSRLGILGRTWLRARARVDITLPTWPTGAHDHDRLLRMLWQVFGGRVLIGGAPAKLRGRARSSSHLALIAGVSALPVTAVAVRAWRGLPWVDRPVALMATLCFALAFFMARFTRRLAPDANTGSGDVSTRSLRSLVALEVDASPSAFEGDEQVALGLTRNGPAVLVLAAMVIIVAGVLVHRIGPWMGSDGMMAVIVIGIMLGEVLAYHLTRARLSLGERGLTLRPLGVFGRSIRVPYARVSRAAIFNQPGNRMLTLVFKGGDEISLGLGLHRRAGLERALRLEAEIHERLSRPASFRE